MPELQLKATHSLPVNTTAGEGAAACRRNVFLYSRLSLEALELCNRSAGLPEKHSGQLAAFSTHRPTNRLEAVFMR